MDETKDVAIVKNILESPLKLSKVLIKMLFENDYESLYESLDEIKFFVGGIKRADYLSSNYDLALYYKFMFPFHQFFNSSFRARQGKVLENILKDILKNYCACDIVPDKPKGTKKIIADLFNHKSPNLDADVVGVSSSNSKAIIIQLRSRDDTGGTTAKSSLVELLKEFLRNNKDSKIPILYLLAIWDARDSQQKNSTIEKVYSSLKNYLAKFISKKGFFSDITKGITLTNNLSIQLSYGTTEISNTLFKWSNSSNSSIIKSINNIIKSIENWDDLWISYAVSSLELDIKIIKQVPNVELLNKYFQKLNLSFNSSKSYDSLVHLINDYTIRILKEWKESSIPFQSPKEQHLYIRDLLFLKACYERLSV